MTDPGQLPDELAALFDAERSVPTTDANTRNAVRARLTAVVALLPAKVAAATSAATLLGGTGKVIAVVAIALGGAGTVAVLQGDEVAPAPPAVALERIDGEGEPTTTPYAIPQTENVSPELVAPTSPHVVATRATPTQSDSTVAPSEAKLLKRAWFALSSGDPKQALELTREAELLSGANLVEERRALEIQALARLGLDLDARSAAEKFIVEFPDSVHRARVERAASTVRAP